MKTMRFSAPYWSQSATPRRFWSSWKLHRHQRRRNRAASLTSAARAPMFCSEEARQRAVQLEPPAVHRSRSVRESVCVFNPHAFCFCGSFRCFFLPGKKKLCCYKTKQQSEQIRNHLQLSLQTRSSALKTSKGSSSDSRVQIFSGAPV